MKAPVVPSAFSWYLARFDGDRDPMTRHLVIGPCGHGGGEWLELGPVDLAALRRDEPGTWREAILKYHVNRWQYWCHLAVPFTGTR